MSGVTPELIWGALGAIAAIAGVAWGIITWVISQFAARDKAIADTTKSLADHKLHAAETFATRAGVTESLDRVFAAIERLTNRVDDLLRIERRRDDT